MKFKIFTLGITKCYHDGGKNMELSSGELFELCTEIEYPKRVAVHNRTGGLRLVGILDWHKDRRWSLYFP